jgi:TRAP-type C4-dicarboxylate transport system substrate-binding protein
VNRVLFVLLLALWPAAAFAQEHTLILGTVAPADSPWSALLVKFKKAVETKSGGKIKVKLKLGGMLGDENEMVTKCHRGQIQAVGASTGALANHVPELHVVELPYLFRNYAEADLAIDTVLTEPLEKLFHKRGLVLGFWSENGYRHFGTRDKVVHAPADLKGKKMRSQESPIHLGMYKAFGASAMPIPTTEVPQALATGNVDGFDQSALYAIATSWTKSIKYFTISEHIYQPAAIVYNQKWHDSLPPELQKILKDEGRALQQKGRTAVREIFPELIEILKSEKIEVYTLTPAERAVFEEAAKVVWKEFPKTGGKEGEALLMKVQAVLAKHRG